MNPNEKPEGGSAQTNAAEQAAKAFIMKQPPKPLDWSKQASEAAWEKRLEGMSRPDRFLSVVRKALERVEPIYYSASAGLPDLINSYPALREKKAKPLLKYLRRHHERVFCYELYHQIRALMDLHRNIFSGVCFQGELKKYQLDDALLKQCNFAALDKEYVPDFLLHGPGHAGDEEVVIEVKCDPLLKVAGARADLKKIQEFITRYGYKAGVFLSINTKPNVIRAMMARPESRAWIREDLPDAARISWVWKEAPGTPLMEHTLSEFLDENAWLPDQPN